jgi:hypothetical protein
VLILKCSKIFCKLQRDFCNSYVSILLSYGADAVARGGGCDSDYDDDNNNGTQN